MFPPAERFTAVLPMLLPILVAVQAAAVQLPAFVEPPADDRLITQYRLQRWTDTDGLPQNSLNAVAQTTDGFLWFASEEGLIRFDGETFIVYNHGNTPAFVRSQALALAAAGDGSLWVGLEGGGLAHHEGGRFTVYGPGDGLPSARVQAVAVAPSGDVWAGTDRGLARVARDGTITVVTGLPHQNISALTVLDGHVWAGTRAGLVRVTDGGVAVFNEGDGLTHPDVRAIVAARGGGLWVGTLGGGVLHFDGARFASLHPRLAREQVTAVSEDAAGGVWVGTVSDGLHRVRDGRVETLHADNGGAAMIWALAHDAEGTLWVGTNGSGLLQLRPAPIIPLGAPEGLSEEIALAVLQTRDGALWVGTANAGLNRISPDGTVRRYGAADGLPERRVLSLAELPDGDLLVGAPNGSLTRYRSGRFADAGRGLDLSGSVMAILADTTGDFWLGTTAGLVRVTDGAVTWRLTAADGLADDFIMTLHRGTDGAVWVGTRQGVSRVEDGQVTPFTAAGVLRGVAVGAFFDGGPRGLWAATQGSGIVRIDGPTPRFLRASDGLCEDMVHAIVDDGAGSAWMSSNRGLFRVSMADLAAWSSGAGTSVQCRLYDRPEGMRSREANGGFMPASARLADGRIVFPTMQGVVTVDPRLFGAAAPPPRPTLRRAVMDGDTMAVFADDRIIVSTQRRDVEFQFTAPFYRGGNRLQFRYRLEGFDSGWRDAGGRRSAHYTNLPPGDYVFRVIAGNEDGEWHPAAADVAVSVPHRFHEAWWFRLLIMAVVAGIAVLWHRHRTVRMQARAERLRALVEERSRAEQRYRDLFENASDMVFTTDGSGVVTSWNSQAETVTGWSKEQAIGRPITEIIPPFGEPADGQRRDVSFATRTGGTAVVEFATRVIEEQGAAAGYQVTGRDMREWRQMQVQLEHAARMEAVGKLAGGIAHDFNNLLTVITSSSEIVTTELSPDSPLRPDLQQIRAAADSAAGLTRQLLAFSRRQMLQPRVVNVNEQVVKVVGMLRRIIGVDIRLETDLAPGTWPVCADEGQLEQVLMNLALNARDAMPEGGTLRFATANADVSDRDAGGLGLETGSYVMLAIEDTGLGIEKDVLPHVFEPFFTTKPAGRGTGLGLATVYGVVRQSGGQILVDSTPGSGTCFRIFLPRTSRTDIQVPDQAAGSADAEPSTARVLLAEDEPAVRRLAERILTRHGFTVRSAGSGGEALAVLQDSGPVDLLVTDMVMPGMNGRELAQQVQALYPDTRILYMSGYTEDEFIRGGVLPEGERFLPKPFTPRALVDAAGNVLAGAAQEGGSDGG